MDVTNYDDGFILKLQTALQKEYLTVQLFHNALQNCDMCIEKDEKKEKKLVYCMENLKTDQQLQCIPYSFREQNVLAYITCSFPVMDDSRFTNFHPTYLGFEATLGNLRQNVNDKGTELQTGK